MEALKSRGCLLAGIARKVSAPRTVGWGTSWRAITMEACQQEHGAARILPSLPSSSEKTREGAKRRVSPDRRQSVPEPHKSLYRSQLSIRNCLHHLHSCANPIELCGDRLGYTDTLQLHLRPTSDFFKVLTNFDGARSLRML